MELSARLESERNDIPELHARVLDALADGITLADERGRIVYTNTAADRILGCAPGELLGQCLAVDLAEVVSRLAAEGAWVGTALHPRKDGSAEGVVRITSLEAGRQRFLLCVHQDTGRMLAERALVQLGAIVESSDDAIVAKDLNGTILSWNKGAERIFGYTADEMIGRHISSIAAPEVVEEIPKILARIASGERVDHYETRRRRKDGQILTVSLTVSPIRDATGRIVGASKIARDITERKYTEEALRELERQLMLLIEASSALLASPESEEVMRTIVRLAERFVSADAHSVWSADTSNIWRLRSSSGLSDDYLRPPTIQASAADNVPTKPLIVEDVASDSFLGQRREALLREGVRSLLIVPLNVHGTTSGTVVFYWRAPHVASERELRIASALGNLAASALRTAHLYERQLQLRTEAETIQRRASFLADAGAALSSSLNYQETLVTVANLAVPGFADWAGVDVLENDNLVRVAVAHSDPQRIQLAYELTSKYPPQPDDAAPMAVRTGNSLLVPDISDEMLVKAARDPEHLRILRELGLRSCIVAPMVLNRQTLGVISFVTAESERIYTAADLQTAEELARRAATALDHARLFAQSQAAQQALEQSNSELRRANADLEQFAFSASHDLQEPLRMVGVYSQMLSRKYKEKLDPRADEYLGFMVEGARRMESLIRDLLAYTRVVNIQEPGKVDPVDAASVLEGVVLNLQGAIVASGARITWGALPHLAVEQVHLVQLFQNLIGNAIKYRSAQPPTVDVTAAWDDHLWKLCIRDNGIGIDPRFAGQIFGIFRRLHRNDEYDGTGIGLAICQKIVHRYGGRIWVESTGQGEGSTFCVTLPGPR